MTKCKLCRIRLKLSLPMMFDIDGGNFTVGLGESLEEMKKGCTNGQQ